MSQLTARQLEKAEIDALVAAKLRWVLASATPVKVILVGSAARYEMTEASDIDLLLIFATRDEAEAAKAQLFRTRPKDDWPHDVLFFDTKAYQAQVNKGGGLCWLAEREGRILHQGASK